VAGIVGWFDDRWSLREALAAAEARQRADWDRLSYGVFWVINSMPNFSKSRRRIVRLAEINPYLRAQRRRVSRAALDAAFDACWQQAEESY
jgi:hypothetical protein